MKRQATRFYILTGLLFILAGFLLSSEYLIQHWQQKNAQPAFAPSKVSASNLKRATVSGIPGHIDIPAVGISVDIEPGYYDKASKAWTLSLDKAEYATITPESNNGNGNTFIYGHNRWAVFYKLLRATPGDEAVVTTTNHHTFVYKMSARHDTNPNDDSLFSYKGAPIMTLQTCSGLWYQHRSLFVFNLVKAS